MGPLSCTVADAILYDHFSPRRSSPVCVETFCDVGSAPAVSSLCSQVDCPAVLFVPRLTVPQFSAPRHSVHMLPLVSGSFVVSYSPLVGRRGNPRRFHGLRDSGPPPASAFSSILEYLSCFRDCLDCKRFAAIPSVSFFRGRARPPGIN